MTEVLEALEPITEDEDGNVTYRIYFSGYVSDKKAKKTLEELHWLDTIYPTANIDFIINSPGGSLTAGDAIYSELYALSTRGGGIHWLRTQVRGQAGSIASLIHQAGDERSGGAMDRLMIHEPMLSFHTEEFLAYIESYVASSREWVERYIDILCARARVPRSEIAKLVGPRDRTIFMDEALELGLIDRIA